MTRCGWVLRSSSIRATSIDLTFDSEMIRKAFTMMLRSAGVVCLLLIALPIARAQTITELQRGFERPPDDARIMMRWWWFGSSVTRSELEREMRLMKEGGIGGFEVQATYPLSPDDPSLGIRNLPYLSDDFLDALRFTSAKAKELGLRMDLTLGSGWPYGGPSVPITDAASTLRGICDGN